MLAHPVFYLNFLRKKVTFHNKNTICLNLYKEKIRIEAKELCPLALEYA